MDALFDCIFASWSPTIGDPTPLGWFTVVAYGVAAIWLWVTARGNEDGERLLWRLCALFLAFLCINKQLDLQSFLTAAGRCQAQQAGWYDDRRTYQEMFIYGILATAGLAIVLMLLVLREKIGRNLLLLLGMVTLSAFIVIRAAGAHKFDALISQDVGPFKINHLLELGGIAILMLACLFRRRSQKAERHRTERDELRLAQRRRELLQRRKQRRGEQVLGTRDIVMPGTPARTEL